MPFLQTNGIQTEYEINGQGEPIVLIAGLGYSRWMWHKMVPYLAQQFQVISYDNRGMGNTDKPAGPYTAGLLAADLAHLLQALHIPKAHIIGHSMGGFIAQAFALNYPHLVDKLILSATHFGGPNHIPVTQEALLVLMDMQSDPVTRLRNGIKVSTAPSFATREPDFIEEWLNYRQAHPVDPIGYQAQLAIGLALITAENSFEHQLPNIQAPTLVLSGDVDKVVPADNVAYMTPQIPNSRSHLLKDVGHFYPFEAPETAATAVMDFLKSK